MRLFRYLFRSLLFFVVFGAISQPTIQINGGAKYTSQQVVNVVLNPVAEPAKMVISNRRFDKRLEWLNYESYLDWNLEDGDGEKTIYVRFKKHNGELSEQYSASIILDTKPPTIEYFSFDKGKFTNTSSNTLDVESNAYQMIISDQATFDGANWTYYYENYRYFIKNPIENQTYTVYLKVRDETGNESEVAQTSITIDRTPPTDYSITISPVKRDQRRGKNYLIIDRAALKENRKQTLEIKTPATDAKYFKFTDRPNFKEVRWTFYKPMQTVKVDITNKRSFTYYVSFADRAQNQTPFIAENFYVDLEPPYEANLNIVRERKNEMFTRRRKLKLNLFALEADSMIISESEDFSNANYVAYQSKLNFTVSSSQGVKIIYARFKDISDNISSVVSDRIILDTIPPQNVALELNQGTYKTLSHILKIKLDYDGANFYQLKTDGNFSELWEGVVQKPFEHILEDRRAGVRRVYVRFADLAGNISETVVDSILLEELPIPVYFKIENDAEQIRAIDYKLNLNIFAHQAATMLISENQDFGGAKWIPYRRNHIFETTKTDGLKTIFIKYKSFTETESHVASDSIYIDNTPPQNCAVILNDGEETIENDVIKIRLYAAGATSMQYAFHSDFSKVPWRPYDDKIITQKHKQDGEVTVYARFKDHLDNIADPVSAKIRLILRPTDAILDFVAGKNYANAADKTVNLKVFARDAKSMLLSFKADFSDGRWEAYRTRKTITLEGEDGLKTIYAKFKSQTETESLPTQLTAILDTKPPYNTRVTIKRLKWTERRKDEDLRFKLFAQDAIEYQISENKNFSNSAWQTYTDLPFDYALKNYTAGRKTLYVRFRDYYDNQTAAIAANVFIEPIQKHPRIIVNDNHRVARDSRVKIQFKDVLAGKDMRISTFKARSDLSWIPYQPNFQWDIPNQDGQVTIYVDYRDSLDKVYDLAPVQFALTRIKPVALNFKTISPYCNRQDGKTILLIQARDVQTMLISNRADFKDAVWQKFKPRSTWQLASGDGLKTIYLKLGDRALNETDVQTAQITLDTKAPNLKQFHINNKQTYTNSRAVRLHLESDDAKSMIVSNSPTLTYQSNWQEFKTDINWQLQHQEGNQVVYVALQDEAGNVSQVFSDTILLDTQAPVVLKFQINDGAVDVDGTAAKIYMKVRDAKFMRFSNTGTFGDELWLPYKPIYNWTLNGTGVQRVYGTFKDKAGNESKPYSDYIMVYPVK